MQIGGLATLSAMTALAILSASIAGTALLIALLVGAARRHRPAADRQDALVRSLEASSAAGLGGACILFDVTGGLRADSVARRLRSIARADDLIMDLSTCRLGMIARGVKREVDLAALVCRCQAAVEDLADGARLTAGLALASRQSDAHGVIRAAERALAIAVARGRGEVEIADPSAEDGWQMENPVASPMLETWIEPRFDTATRQMVAISPLARWRHPALGLLEARDVVRGSMSAEAEATLILRLLEDGLGALDRLETAGHFVPILSLQMTGGSARVSGMAARIAFSLDRADVAPERLELRLSGGFGAEELAVLSRVGCRVAATPDVALHLPDPFGPTSPALLLNPASDGRYAPNPCLGTDRPVVAIGVENEGDLEYLRTLGVTQWQGPALAELQRIPEIANWAAARSQPPGRQRIIGR